MAAGHETTAVALCWTLYYLAQHPHIQEQVYQEIIGVIGHKQMQSGNDTTNGGEQVDIDYDLLKNRLPLLEAVIKESLRLQPPTALFARTAVSNDILNGVAIPAGTQVFSLAQVMHRLPQYWKDPDSFIPQRWLTTELQVCPTAIILLLYNRQLKLCFLITAIITK
jgi:cytochrome P450